MPITSSNVVRDSKSRMSDEQFKNLHALKHKDLKGVVIKCTKEYLSILINEYYNINSFKRTVIGPEPFVVKYNVDEDLKERFPSKTMLDSGTKVVVDGQWGTPLWCERKSLRLDVDASSTDEKRAGAKSDNAEPEGTKKTKRKSSKSPPGERDKEKVVKNASARVIEVSGKDVVLCFLPESGGEKEPIRLQNDLELDLTLCGRKSPEVFKIEDVKDKFIVGDKLKMNAKKKNNVWHVQELIWPKWGLNHPAEGEPLRKETSDLLDSKECKTINLTPIAEETKKDVDTVDNIEPLRKETSDLVDSKECKTINLTSIPEEANKDVVPVDKIEPLRKETSELLRSQECKMINLTPIPEDGEANKNVNIVDDIEPLRKETSDLLQQFDLVNAVLGTVNITEQSVKSKVDLFEAKAKDEAEDQTIPLKPIGIDGDCVTEPAKEDIPQVGMFCRGIYIQDGLEYEGIVKSIESSDAGQYAVVEFIGYGNQEPFWFPDLLKSKGEDAREKQTKEALEEVPVVGEDAKEALEEAPVGDDANENVEDKKGENAREKQTKEALEEVPVVVEDAKEALEEAPLVGEDANDNVENKPIAEEDTPQPGWFCRGVYKEDGLEYEAIVKSIESTNIGSYAVVQFLGYGNEEPIWLKDLLKSKGGEARQKQIEEAGDNDQEEDLANNNQSAVVTKKNITEENQIANQVEVVDEAITKEPMILIKPDAFTVAKLDDQSAVATKIKNVIKDPIDIVVDGATAKPEEPIALIKSGLCTANQGYGCKHCIGFIKVTPAAMERYTESVIKRALQLRDGIHEQVWKEFSENLFN